MNYDDINEIASQITDNLDTNNGLVEGLSAISAFKQPTQRIRYSDESPPESFSISSSAVRPLLSSSGQRARSVTLLETNGRRVINPRATPRTPTPTITPKPRPITLGSDIGRRQLEL